MDCKIMDVTLRVSTSYLNYLTHVIVENFRKKYTDISQNHINDFVFKVP